MYSTIVLKVKKFVSSTETKKSFIILKLLIFRPTFVRTFFQRVLFTLKAMNPFFPFTPCIFEILQSEDSSNHK